MKTKFNTYNESLKGKLKGKSKNFIENKIKNLSNIELESLLINILQNKFESDSESSLLFIEENLNKNRLESIWIVMIYEYLETYPDDIDKDIDKEWMINNQKFTDLLDSMVSCLSFKEIKLLLFEIMFNKPINESLKDKLKGKSEEEISNIVKDKMVGKSDEEKLKYGLENHIHYLVEDSLKNGIDYLDGSYINILFDCVENDDIEIIKTLLKYVDNSSKEHITNLACKLNKLDIVKLSIESGVDVNGPNNLFLLDTIENGNTEIVKYLIEQGVDIHRETLLNDKGERFLILAVRRGNYDIVKLLLENGADPSYSDSLAIKMASQSKKKKNIYKLLKEYVMKKRIKKVKNFMGFNTNESIWEKPEQELTSAKTSVRQIPKPVKILINNNELQPRTINLDIGGGKFENMTLFLSKFGVTNYVYDPFNRSEEHNEMVLEKTKDGQSDSVTLFNVLNVIKEKENQIKVLEQAKNAIKDNGKVYIYSNYYVKGEGAREIKGRNSFQQNYKLNDILSIVKDVFPNAYLDKKLMCVVATK
jgi:ankyrin repeat protein/methyltransferase family protein